jgi:hypothetical protein
MKYITTQNYCRTKYSTNVTCLQTSIIYLCIYREYKVAENSDTIPYALLLFF